jgi:simple sugar transport system permease protein
MGLHKEYSMKPSKRVRLGKKALGFISGLAVAIFLIAYLELSGVDTGSFLNRAIMFSTPLLLATLGEIYAERSGVVNLGIEGMMSAGAAIGMIGAFAAENPWVGALAGMVSGALLALLFAAVVIHLRGMQVPAGLGLFMFGLGFSGVVGKAVSGKKFLFSFAKLPIPVLSDIPIVGKALFDYVPIVYLALALVPIMWFVLFKTRIGLNIRTVGENPAAADSAGVDVFRMRYLCVMVGGALAGLGGAFFSVAWMGYWLEGMTAGWGWVAIALTIFSLWNPLGALLGSLLFGGVYAFQFELQGLGLPVHILGMLPYLVTLVALICLLLFYRRLGAPSALSEPYSRE